MRSIQNRTRSIPEVHRQEQQAYQKHVTETKIIAKNTENKKKHTSSIETGGGRRRRRSTAETYRQEQKTYQKHTDGVHPLGLKFL